MFDVITLGSATVDVFISSKSKNVEIMRHAKHEDVCLPIGAKILIDSLHVDTGGGGTNTAAAFSRLGLRTGWIGKLGDDAHGRHILEVLQKENISFLGKQSKGMSGYSVILTGVHNDRTILAFKGINDKLSRDDIAWEQIDAKWLYVSSMLGQSLETAKSVIKHAKKKGMDIAFNPSLYLAQKGVKSLKELIEGITVLICNREEANALIGTKDLSVDLLHKKLQLYSQYTVITEGAKGASAYDGEKIFTVRPPRAKVVETTGAGDAFASGFVAGLMMSNDLRFALQLGATEANSVIEHIGAKERLLTRSEALSRLKKHPAKVS